MLIIANGAYKSGSTWLFNILLDLTGCPPPPSEFLNADWRNPSIHPEQLSALLKWLPRDAARDQHFLVKNHFGSAAERDLILAHPQTRVLDIQRDLRDVVVSTYYHEKRVNQYAADFETYYWNAGRTTARRVVSYHAVWAVGSPQVHVASYERLHTDFTSEVQQIADFLGMNTASNVLNSIQQYTSLESLRVRYGEQDDEEKFFRKGIIGDWENHFTPAILDDLQQVVAQANAASHPSPLTKALRQAKAKFKQLWKR